MGDTKKILLQENKSKKSVNSDILLDIDLYASEKKFPLDIVSSNVDQYKQYIKERDESNKYRFVFTINPICTNVLYNHISEIISETSGGTVYFYGKTGIKVSPQNNEYVAYKYGTSGKDSDNTTTTNEGNGTEDPDEGDDVVLPNPDFDYNGGGVIQDPIQHDDNYEINDDTTTLTHRTRKASNNNGVVLLDREELIRDTGYSHEQCGNFKYNCGIDIFNNHLFRNNEFVVIADKGKHETCKNYNTINDVLREYNGDEVKTIAVNEDRITHLYYRDTFKTFDESLRANLKEKDGWFGFINPTGIDLVNFRREKEKPKSSIYATINKVINNRNACEFIDLYPDRTLFSFVPKKNNRCHREEYNWDYCITYPYENYTGNTLISAEFSDGTVLNGMLTDFCDSNGNKLISGNPIEYLLRIDERYEFTDILLRTRFRNNLSVGDVIKIHLVANGEQYYTIRTNINVKNVGIDGLGAVYYFSINRGDILSGLKTIENLCGGQGSVNSISCYVQKIIGGRPCKYYFRKFRRLPNFKNSGIYNINSVSNDAINKACLNKFNSSLNKLGFANNIYGDRMAQIVFNDDIDVTNLSDNLGRPLHELFLTIIKANRGYKTWYYGEGTKLKNRYSDNKIECSHCFGEVTSGIDIPWVYDPDDLDDDYNIHKLHNIDYGKYSVLPKFPDSVEHLERNITSGGSKTFKDVGVNGVFLGDIVELDELNITEYVLEDVNHRFNTAQREYVKTNNKQSNTLDQEFSEIKVDNIVTDDFDGEFTTVTTNLIDNYFLNIAPEGYYYKAHYPIQIREFSTVVNEGQHTIVNFVTINESGGTIYGQTDKNYYFQVSDRIYIYDKKKKKHVGIITNVGGNDFTEISFTCDIDFNNTNINDLSFFKPNSEKPQFAYDFDDGSGIYRWRDLESFEFLREGSELYDCVFTNGAHYIHKNINFFLRRQDPYGIYGLNPNGDDNFPYEYQMLEQIGNEKDITEAEHFTEGDIQIC